MRERKRGEGVTRKSGGYASEDLVVSREPRATSTTFDRQVAEIVPEFNPTKNSLQTAVERMDGLRKQRFAML